MLPAVLGSRYPSPAIQSAQLIPPNPRVYKTHLHPGDYFPLCIISPGIYRRAEATMKIIVWSTQNPSRRVFAPGISAGIEMWFGSRKKTTGERSSLVFGEGENGSPKSGASLFGEQARDEVHQGQVWREEHPSGKKPTTPIPIIFPTAPGRSAEKIQFFRRNFYNFL